jgi:hypothetical protein
VIIILAFLSVNPSSVNSPIAYTLKEMFIFTYSKISIDDVSCKLVSSVVAWYCCYEAHMKRGGWEEEGKK